MTTAFCLSGAALATQPAQVARFSGIKIANSSGVSVEHAPVQLTATRNLLSSAAPSQHTIDDPGGDIIADVVLDYGDFADGDVAGLAIVQDSERWISLQTEPITPADLIAVRVHERGDVAFAGRLLATAPLPGSFKDKVQLRIVRERDEYRFYFAPLDGRWHPLATAHRSRFSIKFDRSGPPTKITLHAFDGGERHTGDFAQ